MPTNLRETFSGKKIFLTGHTGFKGSWMTMWLNLLGAEVVGYSLSPPTKPNLFEVADLKNDVRSIKADIRDLETLEKAILQAKPDLVFHLAAQPIVLHSFQNPIETFTVNAIGTVNLLEACRKCDSVRGIVVITTDKCYDNKEWVWGYREDDPLGGHDPYSASKAMAEIAAASYRHSFLGEVPLATARAGNVIGGGDFSDFRLVPDAMRALLNKQPIRVRNPKSTRPWLHVLDPVHGYLLLGSKLLNEGNAFAEAWNFGPQERGAVTAEQLVEKLIGLWGNGDWIDASSPNAAPEMNTLKLNWDKAATKLDWQPLYSWEESAAETARWFKAFELNPDNMKAFSIGQIESFEKSLNQATESLAL